MLMFNNIKRLTFPTFIKNVLSFLGQICPKICFNILVSVVVHAGTMFFPSVATAMRSALPSSSPINALPFDPPSPPFTHQAT